VANDRYSINELFMPKEIRGVTVITFILSLKMKNVGFNKFIKGNIFLWIENY
jgi:hypothetical protein